MKVAFISYAFGEYCIRLASALAADAEVSLHLPDQLAAPHLYRLGETVRFHPFEKPRLRQPLQQLRLDYALIQHINDFHPDVIHIQEGHFWLNFALPFLRRYPLVITVHNPRHHVGDKGGHNTPQSIIDYGFRRADRLIVHGHEMKKTVVDVLDINPDKIDIVPHIVLGDDSDQRDIQEEENLVLFFGRIWPYKGLDYLIEAEPLVSAAIPGAKFVIAGRGEDFSRYRSMIQNPERFEIYNEYVSDEERVALFRRASVVVLPYIEATQSGVIPLAYTFEKPVVATTVGSLPEMVDHDRTGLLIPPRDTDALAKAIIELLENKEKRHQLGRNGKHKVDTEWSPEAVARQTTAVYRQTLSNRDSV